MKKNQVPWVERTEKGVLCFKLFTCLIQREVGKWILTANWVVWYSFSVQSANWWAPTNPPLIHTTADSLQPSTDTSIIQWCLRSEKMMAVFERLWQQHLNEGYPPELKSAWWCCCGHSEGSILFRDKIKYKTKNIKGVFCFNPFSYFF